MTVSEIIDKLQMFSPDAEVKAVKRCSVLLCTG